MLRRELSRGKVSCRVGGKVDGCRCSIPHGWLATFWSCTGLVQFSARLALGVRTKLFEYSYIREKNCCLVVGNVFCSFGFGIGFRVFTSICHVGAGIVTGAFRRVLTDIALEFCGVFCASMSLRLFYGCVFSPLQRDVEISVTLACRAHDWLGPPRIVMCVCEYTASKVQATIESKIMLRRTRYFLTVLPHLIIHCVRFVMRTHNLLVCFPLALQCSAFNDRRLGSGDGRARMQLHASRQPECPDVLR